MKVAVEIVYDDRKEDKEVEVKDGLKGLRFLNAIDAAVNKMLANDASWKRWNLR